MICICLNSIKNPWVVKNITSEEKLHFFTYSQVLKDEITMPSSYNGMIVECNYAGIKAITKIRPYMD